MDNVFRSLSILPWLIISLSYLVVWHVPCPMAIHHKGVVPRLGIEPGTPGFKSPTLTTRPHFICLCLKMLSPESFVFGNILGNIPVVYVFGYIIQKLLTFINTFFGSCLWQIGCFEHSKSRFVSGKGCKRNKYQSFRYSLFVLFLFIGWASHIIYKD